MQETRIWTKRYVEHFTTDDDEEQKQQPYPNFNNQNPGNNSQTRQNPNIKILQDSTIRPQPKEPKPIFDPYFNRLTTINYVQQKKLDELYQKLRQIRAISERRDTPRELKNFVQNYQPIDELKKDYPRLNNNKIDLSQFSGFRKVRGDGNCFFTAFVYSYLKIKLLKDQLDKSEQFVENIKNFKIQQLNFEDQFIFFSDEEQEQYLPQLFNFYLKNILEERRMGRGEDKLNQYFKFDENCFFYEVVSLYIRSKILKDFNESKNEQKFLVTDDQIITWEKEVEINEVIIAIQAEKEQMYLIMDKIFISKIVLMTINNQQVSEYKPENQESNDVITLAYNPGHYFILEM